MDSNAAIERFMLAQNKAKQLIQMDARGGMDKYKEQAKQIAESNVINNNPQPKTYNNQYQVPSSINPNNFSKSKLPKEILESFKNNPIDDTVFEQTSILDKINNITKGELFKEEIKPQTITETTTHTPTSNIDYSMIKIIVEDCMKKYVNTIKKTILNENKVINENEIQAVKIGDKFSFITKNGDLYEAKLKFIKNINKKD